jgi:acetyltransferase-like isoleucine patch superfamily enzyme
MTIKKKILIKNVSFGKNVTIIEPVNLYNCKIGNNCFIGPFVEIQEGSIIGDNTRIQSHSFICSKVKIGKNCFIGHGVKFINDKFLKNKITKDKKKLLNTLVGNNVLIGSNSTILPVAIKNNIVIGAGSVVTKDCKKNKGVYMGNPAKQKKN